MKKIILFFCLLFTLNSNGQDLLNANWCFPLNAGVNFNTATPTPTSSNINFSNPGGSIACASVSDDNGNLRFYTDGINVWNATHTIMPNGSGLCGFSDQFTQQRVVIVPKPGHSDIYYIFTLSAILVQPNNNPAFGRGGIHYSVVNMSSGTGQVVAGLKNIPLKNQNGDLIDYVFDRTNTENNQVFITCKSRITTTVNANGDKIWVSIIPDFYFQGQHTRKFFNYLITANGISEDGINAIPDGLSPKPLVETIIDPANYPNTIVHDITTMKISPNGQYLCDAEDVVNLFNYNNTSGTISFNRNIFTPGGNPIPTGYGLDFSPNGQLIYFTYIFSIIQNGISNTLQPGSSTNYISLYQYQIQNRHLEIIYTYDQPTYGIITPIPIQGVYGLQLAMNNKIYVCAEGPGNQYMNYLGVINLPNVQGLGCNFVPNGLQLLPNTNHNLILPQWVHKVSWPKVYAAKAPQYLETDNNDNIFMYLHEAILTNPMLNHSGTLPGPPFTGEYTFQYNTHSGTTNWTKTDQYPSIALHSGDIQFYSNTYPNNNYDTYYYNANTGIPSVPPAIVPQNEKILAEFNQGFITESYTRTIYVHSSTAPTTSINFGNSGLIVVFNSTTNRLFVYQPGFPNSILNVYRLNLLNNQLNTVSSNIITPGVTNSPTYLAQVDNSNRVYMIRDKILQEYNYLPPAPPSFSPLSISGFTNNNILGMDFDNNYTSDICLVTQQLENNIYAINFNTWSQKKIHTVNIPYNNYYYHYAVSGDKVYLAGVVTGSGTDIGVQHIPALPPTYNSIFLTKLSLQGDFNFAPLCVKQFPITQTKVSFSVDLIPNPANNLLAINIAENDTKNKSAFTILITDHQGKIWLKKEGYISGNTLNISKLKPGVYFVESVNAKGEKITKNLIKL